MAAEAPNGGLTAAHKRLLVLLAAACFSEGFDFATLTVALPQIRSTFGLSHMHADLWVAVLYLGALPAVVWGRRADRRGRRGVLLMTMVGYTAGSAATALAPNVEIFVACQFVTRCFLTAQVAVAWTMAAEDLPAARRGIGFGVLALASALGTGLSAIVQATVLSPMGASWRWLYVLSLPFLLIVVMLSRSLPESSRYQAVAQRRDVSQGQAGLLARAPYRRPLLLICAMILFGNLATEATVFAVDFMESDRGLSASAANLILVAAGAVALPVLTLAGRLSDRVGRRYVCIVGVLVQGAGLLLFFTVARGVAGLGLALMTTYIGLFAAWTTGNAFAVELFPTALRGARERGVDDREAARSVGQLRAVSGAARGDEQLAGHGVRAGRRAGARSGHHRRRAARDEPPRAHRHRPRARPRRNLGLTERT
ncbi:MAG TPA: MFS transporter [Mycobacteriales bacterium]|nr:MFS transporter [Mycobacteriales bacterium]